jgi:cell division protein FtsB
MAAAASPRRRRHRRAVLLRRWLGVGALCLVALLYYRPVHRDAAVRALRAQRQALERKLANAGTDSALVAEARRLGYVKPGERLFIVKGLQAWRDAQRTIRRHGR